MSKYEELQNLTPGLRKNILKTQPGNYAEWISEMLYSGASGEWLGCEKNEKGDTEALNSPPRSGLMVPSPLHVYQRYFDSEKKKGIGVEGMLIEIRDYLETLAVSDLLKHSCK